MRTSYDILVKTCKRAKQMFRFYFLQTCTPSRVFHQVNSQSTKKLFLILFPLMKPSPMEKTDTVRSVHCEFFSMQKTQFGNWFSPHSSRICQMRDIESHMYTCSDQFALQVIVFRRKTLRSSNSSKNCFLFKFPCKKCTQKTFTQNCFNSMRGHTQMYKDKILIQTSNLPYITLTLR